MVVVPGAGRCGLGPHVVGAAAVVLVEAMRERERSGRKKERIQVLYPLMFVGPTHQPTNISELAYVVAVVSYVRRPLDEHKLHTSIFKPMNII
jgi:hypothetical protein